MLKTRFVVLLLLAMVGLVACGGGTSSLIDTDLSDMGRYLRMPFPSKDAGEALTARLTTASEWLGRSPGPAELQSAIGASLAHALRCDPVYGLASSDENVLADAHYRETYGRDAFVFADAEPQQARARLP